MPETLTVGDAVAGRGELKKGYIRGLELANGVSLDVPVLVLNGREPGPTLLLTSTEHGTEIQGIEVIHRIMLSEVFSGNIRGAVIGVPVMNPSAFFAGRYRSWIDHLDVSAVRADQPDGNATQRLAHALWCNAVNQADIIVNMHCNTRPDSMFFCMVNTGDSRTRTDNMKMAEAFGYTIIVNDNPLPAEVVPTYRNLAVKKGVPYLFVEFIDGKWISEPSTSTGVRGVLNVMKVFNMIDGEPLPHPEPFPHIPGLNEYVGMIRPERGGLVRFKRKPGEFINKGETVAEIYSLHGDVLEQVTMPEDGYIWAYPCGNFDDTSGLLQTSNTGCGLAYVFKQVST